MLLSKRRIATAAGALTSVLGAVALLAPASAAAADEVLTEFHFKPVPNLQIAIWLEDAEGNFVQHVYITQATGKLGIANRPGHWNFVSSWHAPYGPRVSVLPVWAHRHGTEYPKVTFFDDDESDKDSLGWHENSSSPENYFCRPLTADENNTISVDTMTCPSPQVFQSDKGRFVAGETSNYPPRNDLVTFEAGDDSPDAMSFSAVNDLDAFTAATPPGNQDEFTTALLPASLLDKGPLTAYIEVALEHDENPNFDFDRLNDHYVDVRLPGYGVEFLGQPSVVYKVAFDPRETGFHGATEFAGYGDWDGATGALHPPDGKISTNNGSGADRLQLYTLNGETFRFGVYSHGDGSTPTTSDSDGTGTSGSDSDGTDSDTGSDSGWNTCTPHTLPKVHDFAVDPQAFDEVRVSFTIPSEAADDPSFDLARVRIYFLAGEMLLDESNIGSAYERSFNADVAPIGERVDVDVDQLFGNYTYTFGIVYEDRCANRSEMATAMVTTDAQKFQQVEGFCFLATAAYGAPWIAEVGALRHFRDAFLKISPTGRDLVRFYYTYSPPLAAVIQREPVLRGMVRAVVQPIADVARLSASPG